MPIDVHSLLPCHFPYDTTARIDFAITAITATIGTIGTIGTRLSDAAMENTHAMENARSDPDDDNVGIGGGEGYDMINSEGVLRDCIPVPCHAKCTGMREGKGGGGGGRCEMRDEREYVTVGDHCSMVAHFRFRVGVHLNRI